MIWCWPAVAGCVRGKVMGILYVLGEREMSVHGRVFGESFCVNF